MIDHIYVGSRKERDSMISPAYARTLLAQGTVPPGSVVSAGLRVVEEVPIAELPEGLRVLGPLDCTANPQLARVRDNVSIDGTLLLNGCRILQSIGNNLYVERDCDLSECCSLTSIGDGFHVGGELNLSGCSPLIRLPENGVVGKDLVLPFDYDIADLPSSLSVSGSTVVLDTDANLDDDQLD
jgi:hypothetical protein